MNISESDGEVTLYVYETLLLTVRAPKSVKRELIELRQNTVSFAQPLTRHGAF